MTTSKKQKRSRGGKRENAGRPTPDGASELQRKTVLLDQETIDKASGIGSGNLSAGLRIAVKETAAVTEVLPAKGTLG